MRRKTRTYSLKIAQVGSQTAVAGRTTSTEQFESEAREFLRRACGALAKLLEAIPTGMPRRAAELEAALRIDSPLAWRTYRAATSTDAFAATRYLMSGKQLERVFDAARRAGIASNVIEAARGAVQEFEAFVNRTARSRTEFDTMVGSLTAGSGSAIPIKHRKAAYLANGHLWGLQQRTCLSGVIIHPGLDEGTQDATMILGHQDVHQIRPHVHWTKIASSFVGDENVQHRPSGSARLLQEFCSNPSPGFIPVEESEHLGATMHRIVLPGLGPSAAVSFFIAQNYCVPIVDDEGELIGVGINEPTECLHLELIAPAGWLQPESAEVISYARRDSYDRVFEHRTVDIVPNDATVTCVLDVADVPPTPDVPRWPEIVRSVLEERGWTDTRHDVFRCRVAYPILHSLVNLKVWPKKAKA